MRPSSGSRIAGWIGCGSSAAARCRTSGARSTPTCSTARSSGSPTRCTPTCAGPRCSRRSRSARSAANEIRDLVSGRASVHPEPGEPRRLRPAVRRVPASLQAPARDVHAAQRLGCAEGRGSYVDWSLTVSPRARQRALNSSEIRSSQAPSRHDLDGDLSGIGREISQRPRAIGARDDVRALSRSASTRGSCNSLNDA